MPAAGAGVAAQELPPPPWEAAAWTITGATPLTGVAATAEALTVVVVCQGALDCPTTDAPSFTGVNWAGWEPRPVTQAAGESAVTDTWGG